MIEDEDPRLRDTGFAGGFERVGEECGLDDEGAYVGDGEGVGEFVGGVGGVAAGEDTAEGEDAEEGHGVVYLRFSAMAMRCWGMVM